MTNEDCFVDYKVTMSDIIDRQDLLIMALDNGDVHAIERAKKNLLNVRKQYLYGKRGVRVD